jgi:hypothetical protein
MEYDSTDELKIKTNSSDQIVMSNTSTLVNTLLASTGPVTATTVTCGSVTTGDINVANLSVSSTSSCNSLTFDADADVTNALTLNGNLDAPLDTIEVTDTSSVSSMVTGVFTQSSTPVYVREADNYQTVSSGANATVLFDNLVKSSPDEPDYDADTGMFTPTKNGIYNVSISICCTMPSFQSGEGVYFGLAYGGINPPPFACRGFLYNSQLTTDPYVSYAVIQTITDTVAITAPIQVVVVNNSGGTVTLNPDLSVEVCRISFVYICNA